MRRLLVPLDGSGPSEYALEFAMETFPDADLVLLHVIDPAQGVSAGVGGPGASEAWYETTKERAEALLADTTERVEATGTTVESAVETGRPAATVVRYAEEHDVDHVVMGSHGREGVSRLLLGSVAEAVVRRSPVPVTVVRYRDDEDDGDVTDETTEAVDGTNGGDGEATADDVGANDDAVDESA